MTITDLDRIAEDAARFVWRNAWRLFEKDEAAFAAAYPILRDEAATNALVDRLVVEWEDEHTVDELPQHAHHGLHQRVNGEWFMAYDTGRSGPWGWHQQTPHDANTAWRRRDFMRKFDEHLARSS